MSETKLLGRYDSLIIHSPFEGHSNVSFLTFTNFRRRFTTIMSLWFIDLACLSKRALKNHMGQTCSRIIVFYCCFLFSCSNYWEWTWHINIIQIRSSVCMLCFFLPQVRIELHQVCRASDINVYSFLFQQILLEKKITKKQKHKLCARQSQNLPIAYSYNDVPNLKQKRKNIGQSTLIQVNTITTATTTTNQMKDYGGKKSCFSDYDSNDISVH